MTGRWFQNRVFVTALAVAGVAFLLFVWPTPYRYDRLAGGGGQSFPVRINRFTGTGDVLYPTLGWVSMEPAAERNEVKQVDRRRSLTGMDLGGIDLSQLRWESTGFIKGPIYNPTNYRLEELVLRVEVYNKKDRTKVLDREYRDTVFIAPRTVGNISFDAGFEFKPGHEWNIKVAEAKGTAEVE